MIIQILGEGQLRVDDEHLDTLNELDARVEAAVEADDEDTFEACLTELLTAVRRHAEPVPDAEIVESDLILPSSDSTIAEVREMLGDEGLIPG